jgi:hypothetical protein
MSVKREKSKSNVTDDSASSTKFEAKIIGNIKRIYNFQKIADFQYLPMCSTSSKSLVNETAANGANKSFTFNAFYDNLLFKNIENYEYELKKNSIPQLFILPPFFSRFDDPVNYAFRSEPNQKQKQSNSQAEIGSKKSNSSGSTNQCENEQAESSASRNNSRVDESNLDDERQDEQNKDEQSNELIRSMRQERSSQALLVTFDCQQIPTGIKRI